MDEMVVDETVMIVMIVSDLEEMHDDKRSLHAAACAFGFSLLGMPWPIERMLCWTEPMLFMHGVIQKYGRWRLNQS